MTRLADGIGDASTAAARDASSSSPGDASSRAALDPSSKYSEDESSGAERRDESPRTSATCAWCRSPLEETLRRDAIFCSRKCRQTAWRLRRRGLQVDAYDRRMRFAYADPPYPGLAAKYYRNEPTFGGEVDHVALIASLKASYDGWALSTSARALRDVLPLCPPNARVCAWVKPIGVPSTTNGIHNTWEPVIVVEGRQLRPGRRDWLRAMPARGGGSLPGRKPIAFCAWLFDLLGMLPGDELVDLFPGTGVVGRAWTELGSRRAAQGDASKTAPSDTSSTPA